MRERKTPEIFRIFFATGNSDALESQLRLLSKKSKGNNVLFWKCEYKLCAVLYMTNIVILIIIKLLVCILESRSAKVDQDLAFKIKKSRQLFGNPHKLLLLHLKVDCQVQLDRL